MAWHEKVFVFCSKTNLKEIWAQTKNRFICSRRVQIVQKPLSKQCMHGRSWRRVHAKLLEIPHRLLQGWPLLYDGLGQLLYLAIFIAWHWNGSWALTPGYAQVPSGTKSRLLLCFLLYFQFLLSQSHDVKMQYDVDPHSKTIHDEQFEHFVSISGWT